MGAAVSREIGTQIPVSMVPLILSPFFPNLEIVDENFMAADLISGAVEPWRKCWNAAQAGLKTPIHERVACDVFQKFRGRTLTSLIGALFKLIRGPRPNAAEFFRRRVDVVRFQRRRHAPMTLHGVSRSRRSVRRVEIVILVAGNAEAAERRELAVNVHRMKMGIGTVQLNGPVAAGVAVGAAGTRRDFVNEKKSIARRDTLELKSRRSSRNLRVVIGSRATNDPKDDGHRKKDGNPFVFPSSPDHLYKGKNSAVAAQYFSSFSSLDPRLTQKWSDIDRSFWNLNRISRPRSRGIFSIFTGGFCSLRPRERDLIRSRLFDVHVKPVERSRFKTLDEIR